MALVKFSNVFFLFLLMFLAACGSGSNNRTSDGATPPPAGATKLPVSNEPAKPTPDDSRPVIVAFGDSLSAGYGLEAGQSFPDQLQNLLNDKGLRYRVVNQGISGDTTSGGLARVDQAVALQPKIVLLELGGNDGLRGIPVANIRRNLDAMIRRFKQAGATVVLVGITLPRNYGDDYIRGFEKNYSDLAKEHSLTYVPFLLEGIWTPTGGAPGMFQDDGIHPTAKGTPVMAATVLKKIEKLL
jgi:acyl-CoA thioesterase-1